MDSINYSTELLFMRVEVRELFSEGPATKALSEGQAIRFPFSYATDVLYFRDDYQLLELLTFFSLFFFEMQILGCPRALFHSLSPYSKLLKIVIIYMMTDECSR